MADGTKIEWTDSTWNPITGCSVVSPGCTNCYAMKLAGTRLRHHPSRAGLTIDSKAGPVWNGEVRLNAEWLDQPLRWKRPRRIFVCAHGDLFHENVPDEWIDRVFAVMALAPQHQFQVLTKRAARMRAYLRGGAVDLRGFRGVARRDEIIVDRIRPDQMNGRLPGTGLNGAPWPLPNVWLGVSAEDQPRANERIPHLRATPAAVRFVSAEPLLGPVVLPGSWLRQGDNGSWPFDVQPRTGVDWVIVGGESGPAARPMHPAWARSLRDQCQAAGVPFFFKQWGEWHPMGQMLADGSTNAMDKGERPGLWDEATMSVRIGKTRAGRLLDGVEHNGFPA